MVKYQFTSSDIIIERKDIKDDIINEQKILIEKLKQENEALKLELLNLKLNPISSIQTKYQVYSEKLQPNLNNKIQFTREIDPEKKDDKNEEQEIVEIISSQDLQKEEQILNSSKEQQSQYYTDQSLNEINLQEDSDSKEKKQEHQQLTNLREKGNLDQAEKQQNENSSYDIEDE